MVRRGKRLCLSARACNPWRGPRRRIIAWLQIPDGSRHHRRRCGRRTRLV